MIVHRRQIQFETGVLLETELHFEILRRLQRVFDQKAGVAETAVPVSLAKGSHGRLDFGNVQTILLIVACLDLWSNRAYGTGSPTPQWVSTYQSVECELSLGAYLLREMLPDIS